MNDLDKANRVLDVFREIANRSRATCDPPGYAEAAAIYRDYMAHPSRYIYRESREQAA